LTNLHTIDTDNEAVLKRGIIFRHLRVQALSDNEIDVNTLPDALQAKLALLDPPTSEPPLTNEWFANRDAKSVLKIVPKFCGYCVAPDAIQLCSGCLIVHYCNEECQKEAWKASSCGFTVDCLFISKMSFGSLTNQLAKLRKNITNWLAYE
jgi:hypothetical protein